MEAKQMYKKGITSLIILPKEEPFIKPTSNGQKNIVLKRPTSSIARVDFSTKRRVNKKAIPKNNPMEISNIEITWG
ncbi:hypothetical protein [Zobellia nedashkovskayae]|uniref:hypothetical protein n=1 Tax=Zobellia nedashkovskayae TaxID=2779510 RepID=UPI00188C658F|nr:hypothetical protein [Zobellia nedashkovskayae]